MTPNRFDLINDNAHYSQLMHKFQYQIVEFIRVEVNMVFYVAGYVYYTIIWVKFTHEVHWHRCFQRSYTLRDALGQINQFSIVFAHRKLVGEETTW